MPPPPPTAGCKFNTVVVLAARLKDYYTAANVTAWQCFCMVIYYFVASDFKVAIPYFISKSFYQMSYELSLASETYHQRAVRMFEMHPVIQLPLQMFQTELRNKHKINLIQLLHT